MIKLNLGCGTKREERTKDFIHVDCVEACKPDVICQLDCDEWPWEDNCVDEVLMCHSLEHMGQTTEQFFHVLKELYRVCAPNALVDIIVPHPRSDGFQGDPTHVRAINIPVMNLFSKQVCRESREKGYPNTPLADYIDVDFQMTDTEYTLYPQWDIKYKSGDIKDEELHAAIDSYFNVVIEIRMKFRVVKNVPSAD